MQLDFSRVTTFLSHCLGCFPGAPGSRAEDQIGRQFFFSQQSTHARRITPAAFRQRSVVIGDFRVVPAGFGVAEEK
jgi:hypothetical protein